jgi:hypothetical protein
MTADRRVARLRTLDTEATPGPWSNRRYSIWSSAGELSLADTDREEDAALIAAMRNTWPAMVELLEGLLYPHADVCGDGCPHHEGALAVLDTLDPP